MKQLNIKKEHIICTEYKQLQSSLIDSAQYSPDYFFHIDRPISFLIFISSIRQIFSFPIFSILITRK